MRLTNCPRLPLPFLQLQICGVYIRSQIPKSECLPAIYFSYPWDTITSTVEPIAASQAQNPTSPPQLR
ncbi:hypothetical protein Hanom_Chr13g01206131 [Helianthus anomalus]